MSINRETQDKGPTWVDLCFARLDELRQSLTGCGPIESTSEVSSPKKVWPVKLAIYQRGGERIAIELPNGMTDSVDSKDIIHWLGVNDCLLGRFRADRPILGFRVKPEPENTSC